jgi:hypothetical protein
MIVGVGGLFIYRRKVGSEKIWKQI